MANTEPTTPFNLLYKVEAQKTTIDKLYEFTTGAGRLIVVGVMVIIIGVFVYRFPLDSQLHDEQKKADRNLIDAGVFLDRDGREKDYRAIIARTKSAKTYTDLYKEDGASDSENEGKQTKFSTVLVSLTDIDKEFAETVIITDYSFSSDGSLAIIKITGASTTFPKAEEYREKVRTLSLVKEANITSLGASREGLPRFSLDVVLN